MGECSGVVKVDSPDWIDYIRRMLLNIIDERKNQHSWRKVIAIIEPTSHDNVVADADQADVVERTFTLEQRDGISLAEAIRWADEFAPTVGTTLYLYGMPDAPVS